MLGLFDKGLSYKFNHVGNTMKKLNQILAARRNNEKGATVIEYALIAALIAVVVIGAVTAIGTEARSTFNSVASAI